MRILLANLDGIAAIVSVDETIVYHEDDARGAYNETCTAREVAARLQDALSAELHEVNVNRGDVPKDWNFDDIHEVAKKLISGYI